MKPAQRALVAAPLALALAACRAPARAPEALVYAPELPAAPRLLAGVARVDITPPVGLSLAGHGPEGRVAEGTRLRLKCTAFVLHQRAELVALVPCELGFSSGALHRAVVQRARALGVPLEPRQLLLSATHTHAGPAHFSLEESYRGAFSSRAAGFDPGVLRWLAERVAGAIAEAYRDREPARLGWATAEVEGLAFNQSVEGVLANRTLPARLRARLTPSLEGRRSEREAGLAQRALDPSLSLLRIDREDGSALGAYVVYGMHPTAAPNTNELYHGDVFGFALRDAEARLRRPGQRVLVGLANGIEGDVVAAVHGPSMAEARRIGEALGAHVSRAFARARTSGASVALAARRLELDFVRHEALREGGALERVCCDPALGAPSGGGANDGPTRFRVVPALTEGQRDPSALGCHGSKLLLQLGAAFVPGRDFPSRVPLQLVQLGDGWLGAAPAELSTVTGERFRAAIAQGLGRRAPSGASAGPIAIVGLANEYLQYVATPDEYELQRYEGASTLYGPRSEPFLTAYFGCLARAFAGLGECLPLPRTAPACATQPEEPAADETVTRLAERPAPDPSSGRITDLREDHSEGERGVRVSWEGFWSPELAPAGRHAVRVEGALGVEADDEGPSVETRFYEGPGAPRWSARWLPQDGGFGGHCGYSYRFVLENERREQLRSEWFTWRCLPGVDP